MGADGPMWGPADMCRFGGLWRGGLAAPRLRRAGLAPGFAVARLWAPSPCRLGAALSLSPPSLLWASRPARDLHSVCCVCPDSGVGPFGARPPASKASPILVFSAQRAVSGGGCSVSLHSEVREAGGCGLGGPGLEP